MNVMAVDLIAVDTLLVRFGDTVDERLVPRIRAACDRLAEALAGQVRDLVPAYATLMIVVDTRRADPLALIEEVRGLLADLPPSVESAQRIVEIPVWYDPSVGPDLERVARYHDATVEDIVRRHAGDTYRVFAFGFAPGFAYLGPVSDALVTPRLDTPRAHVPLGSVALAERQTAVYPVATPGGWNLLGRTPLRMFDRQTPNLCPVKTGDRVRFVSIDRAEFHRLGGERA